MLTIWGRKTSSNVQAVLWCLGELGLPFARHDAGHVYGGTDTPEFLAMNPNGTIPVLRDGEDEPLWESSAILRYLAGRYGDDPFWPRDARQRAQTDKWAEWSKINVTTNFTGPIFWKLVRTAPKDRDEAAIAAAVRTLCRKLAIAEARLSANPFLAGRDFTLADIQFGHLLYRYYDIPIERPDLPALRAYYDALTARAAFREHVMVSYDALKVA